MQAIVEEPPAVGRRRPAVRGEPHLQSPQIRRASSGISQHCLSHKVFYKLYLSKVAQAADNHSRRHPHRDAVP